jgi:hypothetical protein
MTTSYTKDWRDLVPDAVLRVRFFTPEEGGRTGPVGGWGRPFYSCPLMIDDSHGFDCRFLLGDLRLELGETYEVPVAFLTPDLALRELRPGGRVVIWEGHDVGVADVVSVNRKPMVDNGRV